MRTRTHFKTHFVSLVSGVQSRCLRPFFTSTESQESKSEVAVHSRSRQCALGFAFLIKNKSKDSVLVVNNVRPQRTSQHHFYIEMKYKLVNY